MKSGALDRMCPGRRCVLGEKKRSFHRDSNCREAAVGQDLALRSGEAACGYGVTFFSEYHINRLTTGGETCNCVLDDPLS